MQPAMYPGGDLDDGGGGAGGDPGVELRLRAEGGNLESAARRCSRAAHCAELVLDAKRRVGAAGRSGPPSEFAGDARLQLCNLGTHVE